jgi:CO dehydrogenase/acetyl-CoA synthase alpha subunit
MTNYIDVETQLVAKATVELEKQIQTELDIPDPVGKTIASLVEDLEQQEEASDSTIGSHGTTSSDSN